MSEPIDQYMPEVASGVYRGARNLLARFLASKAALFGYNYLMMRFTSSIRHRQFNDSSTCKWTAYTVGNQGGQRV